MSKTVIIDRRTHKNPAKIIHNEVTAMQSPDNGQRDDREATTPQEDLRSRHSGLPDGWRWQGSKVVPTPDAVRDRIEQITYIFSDREGREQQIEVLQDKPNLKKLQSGFKQYLAEVRKFNDFAYNGYFYKVLNDFINSVHFFDIYSKQVDRLMADDQDISEAEIKQHEAMKQALAAASALDCLLDFDDSFEIDWKQSVYKFLCRQGEWVRDNFGKPSEKKAVQRTTSDHFFNRSPRTPDRQLEASEEELDAAING